MALTRAEQREAADLVERLLDLVEEGNLAADGPAGAALVRRLEGALLALRTLDRPNGPGDAKTGCDALEPSTQADRGLA